MRNLKKVLSLALALVMLLGLMMVGAGAVDTGFKDDTGISDSYKEAAAINKALNIMQGSNGNLNPNGDIVRAEAFILSLRVGGPNNEKIASSWPISDQPFADASGWYSHYLSYGKDMALINGVGGTNNYNPDGKVTAVEYAILLLRQMGMDNAAGDRYTGTNWRINALNDAAKVGLFDGLTGVSYTADDLTRQEACQMAFNALLYSPNGDRTDFVVTATEADDTTTTLYSGTNETAAYLVYSQAKGDKDAGYKDVKVTEETTTVDSLGEKAFGLKRVKSTDDLGRTAVTYTASQYKLNLVIAEGADYTFEGKVTNKTLYNTLGKNVANTYTWNVKIDGILQTTQNDKKETVTLNAQPTTSASAYQDTEAGALTEIYVDADKKEVNVFISYYRIGSVSKVAPAKNGDPRYVMIDGKKYETEAFEAKDVVIYTLNNNDIETVELAPELTAVLTKIVNNKTYTLDGKTYVCAKEAEPVSLTKNSLGEEFTFYTDPMGNIMKLKGQAAAANTDYLWVVANSGAQENPDYITSTTYPYSYKAYGIQADGTVKEWNVIAVGENKVHPTGKDADGKTIDKVEVVTNNDGSHYGMYAFEEKGDSVILTAVTDKAEANIQVNKPGITYGTGSDGKTAVANSKTTFVFFAEKSDSDHTIVSSSVQVGIANIGTNIEVKDEKGKDTDLETGVGVEKNTVQVVFVKRPYDDGSVTDEAGVAYLLEGSEKKIDWLENGKKSTRYEYTGIDATGDTITLTYTAQLGKDDAKYGGEVWSFDEDYRMIASLAAETRQWAEAGVEYISTDAVKLGDIDHAFNLTDDTSVVFVDDTQGGELAAGDVVVMVTEAGTGAKHWNAQVVYVVGAAAQGSVVTPSDVKNDKGETTGWSVNPDVGDSFVVSGKDNVGAEDQKPVIVPGNSDEGFDDWAPTNGNVSDVMGFTFAIDKKNDKGGKFTLTIKDSVGNVKYCEQADCSGNYETGVFYVQVVNTVKGETAVSNKANGTDKTSNFALNKELDKDTYTWTVTFTGSEKGAPTTFRANGSFVIDSNGDNTKE